MHFLKLLRFYLLPAVCLVATLEDVSRGGEDTQRGDRTRTTTPVRSKKNNGESDLSDNSGKIPLHVIGLFGKTGTNPSGTAFQYAAEMAIKDVNARPDVLPGYELVLDAEDTKCDNAIAMDRLYKMLYNTSSTKFMVIGALLSHVSEVTAKASRMWNLVQVSYSAISPTLSDKKKYPWFFRTSASESSMSPAMMELLRHFKWTVISVAQQSFNMFTQTVEVIAKNLQHNNITVNTTETIDLDVDMAIQKLQAQDARIIYFASYEKMARKAACAAYKRNFFGPKIVWIFPGYFDHNWYERLLDSNCSVTEILKVIDGYFAISIIHLDDSNGATVGLSPADFKANFSDHQKQNKKSHPPGSEGDTPGADLHGSSRAPLAYDAVWAAALALNGTLTDLIANGSERLENFTYQRKDIGHIIYQKMKAVSFKGLSGNISFDQNGDRKSTFAIYQFQKGKGLILVAKSNAGGSMEWNDTLIKWRTVVPASHRQTKQLLQPLPLKSYIAMCSLAGVGMLTSVVFLGFNFKYRYFRTIKMSSPNINNLILAGCLVVYSDVFIEDITASRDVVFCYAKLYLMVIGFSMSFGALFSKTWRVYKIMTASITVKARSLRDRRLLTLVGVVVLVNLLLLIVWSSVDPYTVRATAEGAGKINEKEDVLEISEFLECTSQYKTSFCGVAMAVQGVFMIFGVFLAWQTRQVRIRELNDSRWIGLCIYNVVALGSLGGILVFLTHLNSHVTYLIESTIVCLGTTVTQCLLFVPKLLAVRRAKDGDPGGKVDRVAVGQPCSSLPATCSCQQQSSSPPTLQPPPD